MNAKQKQRLRKAAQDRRKGRQAKLSPVIFRRVRTRIELRLSARQVAERMGVPLGTFYSYENESRRTPENIGQAWDSALRDLASETLEKAARIAKVAS